MGQLPELMKNYKDGETEILTGLEEKLQEVFQKAQQMQKADRKGKICTMGISYLQSSVLTGNYELRIDLYDKEFYLDSAECCTYWKPEFVTGYLLQDVEYFKKEIRFKIPQIKTYELQQFIDGYLLNYMYLHITSAIFSAIFNCSLIAASQLLLSIMSISTKNLILADFFPSFLCHERFPNSASISSLCV